MMGTRERMINGDEYDYLTRARRFSKKKPGKFTQVKQAFWQRVRKARRLEAINETRGA